MIDIDLSKLSSPVLELEKGADYHLTGTYKGPRILCKNAVEVDLFFDHECRIVNDKGEEETFVFFDGAKDTRIRANGAIFINGGIQSWGDIDGLLWSGGDVLFPHTGFRSNGPQLRNTNIVIVDLNIHCPSHEGFYIGPHQRHNSFRGKNVAILNCLVKSSGWDAFQVGNTDNVIITGCEAVDCAISQEVYQDHNFVLNGESTGFVWDNDILISEYWEAIVEKTQGGRLKPSQFEGKTFDYSPDGWVEYNNVYDSVSKIKERAALNYFKIDYLS